MITQQVRDALRQDRNVDITTIGRRSGRPRRVEIWFHNLDGRLYISGLPGRRDWYANLLAKPAFTFHLKETTQADLPASPFAAFRESNVGKNRMRFEVVFEQVEVAVHPPQSPDAHPIDDGSQIR